MRQREPERRALIDRAFGPGAAAVAMNDAPHVSQADAVTVEFVPRVEPLECAEETVGVGRIEPAPLSRT